MAKKKAATAPKKSSAKKAVSSKAAKSSVAKKSVAKPRATTKKPASKKSDATPKKPMKKTAKKAAVSPAVSKAAIPPVAAPSMPADMKTEPSLGRPLVTQEEKLYWAFHDDFQARKVFEFLQIETIKELEQFSQQQIVHLLSKPTRMTVERIRERLAQYKRCLKDDEQYAADYIRRTGVK